jgi:hypothetical protein
VWSAALGRISTSGELFAPIPSLVFPFDLTRGPDDTVYWTGRGDSLVFRCTPDGIVSSQEFVYQKIASVIVVDGVPQFGSLTLSVDDDHAPVANRLCHPNGWGTGSYSCSTAAMPAQAYLTGLILGPDGKVWAANDTNDRVLRFNGGAALDTTIDVPAGSRPWRLATGSDGNVWVAEYAARAIDRITPAGTRTRSPLPHGGDPNDIAVGPDGALWIAEYEGQAIVRMTTDGQVTNEFRLPTAGGKACGVTTGPDGAIWFTDCIRGRIGRVQLDSSLGGGGGGVADRFAPRFVRRAAFNPKLFRLAAEATPTSARRRVVPKGSVLSYSLSEPASVTIVIALPAAGRKVGKTCKAPTRSNRRRQRCTRYLTVGTLKRRGLQGANRVVFTGRIGRKALRAGAYRVTATAKDAAGNVSKPSTASFTIAAR